MSDCSMLRCALYDSIFACMGAKEVANPNGNNGKALVRLLGLEMSHA